MSLKMSRFGTSTYNLSFFSYYSVTLNWSPPINRGGVELTGYVIEKRLVSCRSKSVLLSALTT